MSRIRITCTGTSPLLCHNIQMADPDNQIVREIAAITRKRANKTEDDRKAIAKLEWFGGLYTFDGIAGPAMKTANMRKCLIRTASITRLGKGVERALFFHDLAVPIAYDGPRDLDALCAREAFHDRVPVGIGKSRVMRTRPKFPQWSISAEAEILTDILDLDVFLSIVERAGVVEGLGDNRVNGFGRFMGSLEVLG